MSNEHHGAALELAINESLISKLENRIRPLLKINRESFFHALYFLGDKTLTNQQ